MTPMVRFIYVMALITMIVAPNTGKPGTMALIAGAMAAWAFHTDLRAFYLKGEMRG